MVAIKPTKVLRTRSTKTWRPSLNEGSSSIGCMFCDNRVRASRTGSEELLPVSRTIMLRYGELKHKLTDSMQRPLINTNTLLAYFLAQVAWEDLHLVAILCHGSSRHRITTLAKHAGQFLIAHCFDFGRNQLAQHILRTPSSYKEFAQAP